MTATSLCHPFICPMANNKRKNIGSPFTTIFSFSRLLYKGSRIVLIHGRMDYAAFLLH